MFSTLIIKLIFQRKDRALQLLIGLYGLLFLEDIMILVSLLESNAFNTQCIF